MMTMVELATEPQQSLPTKTCKNCGHEWIPRVPNPRRCPKCLSYDWDKEKEVEEDNKSNISGCVILEKSSLLTRMNPFPFLIHEFYKYEVGIAAK